MYEITRLKNGLTLITASLPHLNSVTSLISVGAGSRYETKKNNGLSHFLEHMFFKGSKKYPSAEIIATLVDSVGAVNNAATHKEWTYYWIKSSAKSIELSCDILSSMIKEPLLKSSEIEMEKGVITEELRMYKDNPARYVWDLYEKLQFGDQPLGWDIGGDEKTVHGIKRVDFVEYINSLYSPENMALVFAGKLPKNIKKLAEDYFLSLPKRGSKKAAAFKKMPQNKPRVNVHYKKTDQANLILGVEGLNRDDKKKYAAKLLAVILGEGMSSRLFLQVRERRGLAYHVAADSDSYKDTGAFVAYAGLKLEKIAEGIKVIRDELEKTTTFKVSDDELKKGKEIIRGRLAIRSESTNYLAEHFGTEFVLDKKLQSFEEYLKLIDSVTAADLQAVARELFASQRYNLQIIGPFKNADKFQKLLS